MGRRDYTDDPRNVKGLGSLLNADLISDDIDPNIIEQSIVNELDDLETVEEIDPIKAYEVDCAKIIADESGEDGESSDEDEDGSGEEDGDEEGGVVSAGLAGGAMIGGGSSFQKMTEEHAEQGYINNLIVKRWGVSAGAVQSDMPMRLDEHKLGMLEEIDDLMSDLKGEVDLTTLPTVNYNSQLEDIERVHIILRKKHQRVHQSNIATDWVLMLSNFSEVVFDGEREIFGFRPNLKGISKKLKVKMHRIRHDTSQVVGQILDNNNIGPIMRIGIELLPTILIHNQINSVESKNLNERLSTAQDNLRAFDPNYDRDDVFR